MNVPFNLTLIQSANILQIMHSYWPDAIQAHTFASISPKFTPTAWQLRGEHKDHQPFENLTLLVVDPQLILTDDGTPQFSCTRLEFVYENGYISHGIPNQQSSIARPTSFKALLSPEELRNAFQELRTLSSKVPIRRSAA